MIYIVLQLLTATTGSSESISHVRQAVEVWRKNNIAWLRRAGNAVEFGSTDCSSDTNSNHCCWLLQRNSLWLQRWTKKHIKTATAMKIILKKDILHMVTVTWLS